MSSGSGQGQCQELDLEADNELVLLESRLLEASSGSGQEVHPGWRKYWGHTSRLPLEASSALGLVLEASSGLALRSLASSGLWLVLVGASSGLALRPLASSGLALQLQRRALPFQLLPQEASAGLGLLSFQLLPHEASAARPPVKAP